MDIRIEKTRRAIINTFLELRSKKPLEKIHVKDLCEAAQINKSTFYSHFKDIYDLSEELENEVVLSVIRVLQRPEELLDHPAEVIRELFLGYFASDTLIQILFSGSRSGELVTKLEKHLKEQIFSFHPEYKNDMMKNVAISYSIYGSYYAFQNNRKYGDYETVDIISQLGQECLKLVQ